MHFPGEDRVRQARRPARPRRGAIVLGLFAWVFAGLAPPVPAVDGEGDVIRFATISANYRVGLQELVDQYEALHPEIKVELTIISQEFETWLRASEAAGGDLVPDIYNANFTAGYEKLGKWVELDAYLDSKNPYTGLPWRDTFEPSMLERYRSQGHYYILPIDSVEIAVYYNQDIFDELGLTVPSTWDEWLETCRRIDAAGLVPIAIGGDADSFWAGDMGWLVRLLGDVYLRDQVPHVVARPGDWDYDPARNEGYEYIPGDPFHDMLINVSGERSINAILDGTFDFGAPKFRRIYTRLMELSAHFEPGFMGVNMGSAVQLFYMQRAAMCLMGSGSVVGILHDFERFSPEDRFAFGNFWFPTITDDPLACGPFRGVGGGGMVLAVMNKGDDAHHRNVIDFLQYMTTPDAGRLLVERTLEDEQAINGPLLIKGVDLPGDLEGKYEVFLGNGFEKINFRGLMDEQESVNEWVVIAQELMGGRMSLDEFCEAYNQLMRRAAERIVKRDGLDLDPSTADAIPARSNYRNPWNPFENGSLMLAVIVLLFAAFAGYHIRKAKGHWRATTRIAYLLLFPTVFMLATFSYYPALSGLYHAFTEWEPGRQAVFVGLDNFRRLLADRAFFIGMWNMVILLVAGLFKALVVPFLAAELIVFLSSGRLRYAFRTAFLLPMVVPGMVGILIWRFIYDPNIGMLNNALNSVGLEALTANWLGDPALALGSIIFMGFPWIGAFGLLIYLAGLMQIPTDVYEAYSMESTNYLKRIWHVDVPLVRGQTRLLAILTFIGSVQDFQTILIMTRGGPGTSTYVPALRMYYQAITYQHYGYGAAIGLVLFALILLITLVNMKVFKPAEVG